MNRRNTLSRSPSLNPVLIVMAKAPRIGQVNTRLCPPLTPQEAASLAACFLQDMVAKVLSVVPSVLIAYAPAEGREEMERLLSAKVLWTPQQGDDLGARMAAAMQDAAQQGFHPLVLIGTDSPTLSSAFLLSAIEMLANEQADMVVVPTDDGGFSLIGLKTPVSHLFDGVAWSTPDALTDTMTNAAALGLHVTLLPQGYDIDTAADLRRLHQELKVEITARGAAPRTYEWLNNHENFGDHSCPQ